MFSTASRSGIIQEMGGDVRFFIFCPLCTRKLHRCVTYSSRELGRLKPVRFARSMLV